MKATANYPVVLLIDHRLGLLLPLNQRGLARTQKSRRQLQSDYPNAELLLPSGELLPIVDFKLGRATDFGMRWPIPWLSLSGERVLEISLGPSTSRPFTEIRDAVVGYLENDSHRDDWLCDGESWDELMAGVRGASSIQEVFKTLHLTSPEDGLDVFS